jgi:plastocyanin
MPANRRALGLLVAVSLTVALAVAACGGAGQDAGDGGGEPVATSVVDLPPSYKFVPESIAVTTGTTVTWTNNDNFTHSVRFLDGGLPSEPLLMQPGASTTFTFSTAGTYRYECHLHPQQMQGTVAVTG